MKLVVALLACAAGVAQASYVNPYRPCLTGTNTFCNLRPGYLVSKIGDDTLVRYHGVETVKKLAAETERIRAQTVKEGVESAFSAIQTAEVIAAVPAVAPVADKVLQAAGYTPPVPAGVDPNLPQPPGTGTVTMLPVQNRRTGTEFQPGADPMIGQNTSPMSPAKPAAPAAPGEGAAAGIETMRAD